MRRVEISELKKEGINWNLVKTGETAKFHQFGCDFEEFEMGPGNYSTAIIELDDGSVRNVPVNHINFLK